MRLRIMRSVFKITKAVTTANASRQSQLNMRIRTEVVVQDKVNFIKNIHLEDIPEEKPSINDREKRRAIIEGSFVERDSARRGP